MIVPAVLALDLSLTCTGYVTPDGDVGQHTFAEKGVRRLYHAREWIKATAADADIVAIEGYSYASRGRASISLGELGGVVRTTLYELRVPSVEVPPSCIKKYATGRGNAGKEEVLVEAVKRLDYTGHSTDEADALWLWTLTLAALGAIEHPVPKSHQKALAKIKFPEV